MRLVGAYQFWFCHHYLRGPHHFALAVNFWDLGLYAVFHSHFALISGTIGFPVFLTCFIDRAFSVY